MDSPLDHPEVAALAARTAKLPTISGLKPYAGLTTIDPVQGANVAAPTASGTLHVVSGLVAIKGKPITGVAFRIGTTVAATNTNLWFMIGDMALNVLAKTVESVAADGGTVANTWRRLDFATPYVPTDTQEVYAGINCTAGTMPTTIGVNTAASVSGALNSGANRLGGTSTTGLTNPASLGATFVAPATSNLLPLAVLL